MLKLYINADQFTKQLKTLEKSIVTTIKDVQIPGYFQELQRIAAEATKVARVEIKLATTETGRRRAAAGGNGPGRIDTGKFYDGITWEARRRGKGLYEVRIGWLNGQPDWASYQELGFTHRSGMYVAGADALGSAQRYFENELAKLGK